jgi:2-oxoisovalerate dehydrogenase E1 component beta subunit
MSAPVRDAPTWFAGAETAVGPIGVGDTTYLEALRWALEDELAEDERVLILGQDIGLMGGAFRVTQGLQERFGEDRVRDTPIAEIAMVGAGIGLAISGWRPIIELQFADFVSCAYDQLVTEAAKLHYRFGIAVPMVVRGPSGAGVGAGPFHSQSPEGVFAHIPGLKVVCPGTPQDAYDLMRASVADPNPVLLFEHKALYRSLKGTVVRGGPVGPLGEALVRRTGSDLTIVTYGGMVPRCLDAAEAAATIGIECDVVDLRTVHPFDTATVLESVGRTGRALVVHEDTCTSGIGAEVAARLADLAFFDLDAPVRRVTAPDTPVPFAQPLEERYVPSVERIRAAIEELASL